MASRSARHASRREFDREAPGYDRTAAASMPGYSDLHRALLGGIPFLPTRSFRVLELGVGTGTFTALLLAQFPHAEVFAIDLSPRMIARARTKLRTERHRVQLIAGDLGEFPEERFDAVVSALAIHHLSDPKKWKLFRRVHRALTRGGFFGDADDHLPEDPLFDQRYSQMAASLSAEPQSGARWATLQEVWHAHERFDHPCTLSAETEALGRAGFAHVGVPWRFFGQAVVWAYK